MWSDKVVTRKGIDISKWQGTVNFEKVKNSGIDFVILRAGYHETMDPRFPEYVSGALTAGLTIAGVYWFSYALDKNDAVKEANACSEYMKRYEVPRSAIVFYDFEYDTVDKAKSKGYILGKNECCEFTRMFCERIMYLGYRAGVYTNMDYYKRMYTPDLINRYVFWLADYTAGPDVDCEFQQYSSKGSVPGIAGNVDMDYWYVGLLEMNEKDNKPAVSEPGRAEVVNLARSWIGLNEADGSYKSIIDIYNSFVGKFPRGLMMQYDWAWCAATWSAIGIKLGIQSKMRMEISCYYLMKAAEAAGIWIEDDSYIPLPGDGIMYCWSDNGIGDNQGTPNHVGTVEYTSDGYIVAIEGNYQDAVKRRSIPINGRYIRGFIAPAYADEAVAGPTQESGKSIDVIAREVITGLWGTGEARKAQLTLAGYDYAAVQKLVNEILNTPPKVDTNTETVEAIEYAQKFDKDLAGTYVTTAKSGLYCRSGAGKNKTALCLIPVGTKATCYGYYTPVGSGALWYFVQFTLDNVLYKGFVSSGYLVEV